MTPHNEAAKGDYARTVLLPGDPDRAAWIARTLLDDARQVNSIRGALGFTGSWRGMPVSVQATGIGRPSFLIYAHELFATHGVRRAIRVGTCGGLLPDVAIRHVAVIDGARMDLDVASGGALLRPDADLLRLASGTPCAAPRHVGPMVSSDSFYHPDPVRRFDRARDEGAIACDMETAALYGLAAANHVRALSICTVVDNLVTGEETALAERQQLFRPMVDLALATLLADFSSQSIE